jgi:protein phosphatase
MMTGMRAQLVVTVPDPSLIVLVGAAGSGKSTFAARHFASEEVLSSDAYRALVAGDPSDQAATGPAFAALHADLARRLGDRRLTVVDATNVQAHARLRLLRRAAKSHVPAVAIVLDLPTPLVLERNASRQDRMVPEAVMRRQLADLGRTLRGRQLEREGFAMVVHLAAPADVDAARIMRRR